MLVRLDMFLFDRVNKFEDLKYFSDVELVWLVDEFWVEMILVVFEIGGYLGVGFGVVELIVVLYVVFDMFKDKLIWDVSY